MSAQTITFDSPEAPTIVAQTKFLDDVRNIDWNEIYDDCVHIDEYREHGRAVYRATAFADAGGEEWSQTCERSDMDMARVEAVSKLFAHLLRLALNMRRGMAVQS